MSFTGDAYPTRTAPLGRRLHLTVVPGGMATVAWEAPVNPLLRWAFLGFVFSLLFEVVPGLPFEVTRLTAGLLLAAALLLQPRLFMQRPPLAFICFAIYLYVGMMATALSPESRVVLPRLVVTTQLFVVSWFSYCLLRQESVARQALVSLGLSAVALSILQILGLTATTVEAASEAERLSAFGLDPNHVAGCMALGLLGLVGLLYGSAKGPRWLRLMVWPAVGLIALTIAQTGSRGGLVALVVGLVTLAFAQGNAWTRLRNGVVILGVVLFFGVAVIQSGIMRTRFERALSEGTMTKRELFYPLAWRMFLEKPLTGWGPVTNTMELGKRFGHPAYERLDTHNLVLYVLTATGLVGSVPFLLGIGMCVRTAWKCRAGPLGIAPFALTVTVLVADMSVSGIHWKQHWLVMAIALACAGHGMVCTYRTDSARSAVPADYARPSRELRS